MTIDPKIKRRIQKLLALGGNNENPNEANNALKKAAALAEEYGLALSDIDEVTGKVKSVDRHNITIQNQSQKWVIVLAIAVSKAFECEVITHTTISKATNFKRGQLLVFLGTPTDLELALWYFKFIKIRVMRQMSKKYAKSVDKNTYALGSVTALRVRLHDMFIQPRIDARSKHVKDLVVVKDQAIQDEMKAQFGQLKSKLINTGRMSSRGVYEEGQKDGRNMSLHRGHITA